MQAAGSASVRAIPERSHRASAAWRGGAIHLWAIPFGRESLSTLDEVPAVCRAARRANLVGLCDESA